MRNAIVLTSLLILFFTSPIAGWCHHVYEIRQENYTYHMPVTRTVTAETFVIVTADKMGGNEGTVGGNEGTEKAIENDSKIDAENNCFAAAHFMLDSFHLSPAQEKKILAGLARCGITTSSPLVVTGYTCPLGPDEHNQTLSLQRARAVADFLQAHGYRVAAVEGKGSQDPVANEPALYCLNRRVTVRLKSR